MTWRWLAILVVAAALLAPAASAKEVSKILAVGANGRSVDLGSGWPLLQQIRPSNGVPVAAPSGPYFLLYPLMKPGLPMEPARYYPSSEVGCWSWSLGPEGCVASAELPESWLATAGLRAFTLEPTTLKSLSHDGASYTVPSNGSVAIELAVLRTKLARPAPASRCRWRLDATWLGPAAGARPSLFCLRTKGVSARGRLYPLSRAVVWTLHAVG